MTRLCALTTPLTAALFAGEFSPLTFQLIIAQEVSFIWKQDISPGAKITNKAEEQITLLQAHRGAPVTTNSTQNMLAAIDPTSPTIHDHLS